MAIKGVIQRLSGAMTQRIALRWGDTFPCYYVCEYPKSGGTWLGSMLGAYFQIPFPQNTLLPLAMPCVIHNHWRFHPGLRRACYIIRDGRDALTSYYFHHFFLKGGGQPGTRTYRRFKRLFGRHFDPEDIGRLLPIFLEHELGKQSPWRLNWVQHIASWQSAPMEQQPTYVRYEDLLAQPEKTLTYVLEQMTSKPVDKWRVATVVEQFSFKRQTGRAPGTEERSNFQRKGIAGDWRNHFTRAAANVFNELAGDTLVALGYESNLKWVDRYDYLKR